MRAFSGEAARREKRGRRLQSRVVICVSRAFCSTDQENRETARSLGGNGCRLAPDNLSAQKVKESCWGQWKVQVNYCNSDKEKMRTTSNIVCYTAVFSVVTQRSSPQALRDDTKNGCVADYVKCCSWGFSWSHNKISSTDSKSWNCVHLCLHDWCWKFKG